MSVLSRFAAPHNPVGLQAAPDKFTPFLSVFLEDVKSGAYTAQNRTVRLLAHSHDSKVTRTIFDKASEMAALNVKLELILSDLPIGLEFEAFLKEIEPLLLKRDNKLSFRWAQNRCLLDAHEQMILGSHSSWSGDTLKRVSHNAYHVDMFESDDIEAIKLGEMAFSAMWMASVEVPAHRLKRITSKNSGQKKQFFSQIAQSLSAAKWAENLTTRH